VKSVTETIPAANQTGRGDDEGGCPDWNRFHVNNSINVYKPANRSDIEAFRKIGV
jgi:hypothetical protein